MKKSLFFAAVSVLALSSCSNDETINEIATPNQAIGFEGFVNKSTRGADLTTDNLKEFLVWGVTWNEANRTPAALFQGVDVTGNKTDGWTYSPLRYWTKGNMYHFSALAPATALNSSLTITDQAMTEIENFENVIGGLKIQFNNETAAANQDLIYAFNKYNYETNASSPGPVPFTFNHMLSRVRFTFVNEFPTNGTAISISNIVLKDAVAAGTYDFTVAQPQWELSGTQIFSIDYSIMSMAGDAAYFTKSTVTNYDDGAETGSRHTNHFYLIPDQSETGRKYTIAFDVTMFTIDIRNTSQTAVEGNTYNHTQCIVPAVQMQPGYSYNFVAKINVKNIDPTQELEPIVFTLDKVSEWKDWDETDPGEISHQPNPTPTPDPEQSTE